MSKTIRSVGITLARAGAVLFALVALGCLVVNAHNDANPEAEAQNDAQIEPTATGKSASPGVIYAGPTLPKPVYLPSTKFAVVGPLLTTPVTEGEKPMPFLYSSKSLSIAPASGVNLKLFEQPTNPQVAPVPKVFLPSSKSGRVFTPKPSSGKQSTGKQSAVQQSAGKQ